MGLTQRTEEHDRGATEVDDRDPARDFGDLLFERLLTFVGGDTDQAAFRASLQVLKWPTIQDHASDIIAGEPQAHPQKGDHRAEEDKRSQDITLFFGEIIEKPLEVSAVSGGTPDDATEEVEEDPTPV